MEKYQKTTATKNGGKLWGQQTTGFFEKFPARREILDVFRDDGWQIENCMGMTEWKIGG
jgi:hypothetical protein